MQAYLPRAQVQPLGGDAAQVFLGNPHSWEPGYSTKAGPRADCPTWVHAPYIVHVASVDPDVRKNSRRLLYKTLENAHAYGAQGVVVHPGGGHDPYEGYERWVEFAQALPAKGVPSVPILLENSAGRGCAQEPHQWMRLWITCDEVSASTEDSPSRFGLCLDTQHAWAAGWTPADFLDVGLLMNGAKEPDLVHANGSLVPQDSKADRHANLGSPEDLMGLDYVGELLRDLPDVPAVLETYGDDSIGLLRAVLREEL